MVSTRAFLAGTALAAISHAANIQVQVGKSGLSYDPPTIAASVGDTVSFVFDGTHSVVEATFDAPCTPMTGGFEVPAQSSSGAVFTIEVTTTDPMWFYCSVSTISTVQSTQYINQFRLHPIVNLVWLV
jgi:plastocyanin